MQSLYELLKASKGLPVSDSYAALWGKSAAESGIKTLTGRLPLFFKTSESKLRDWVIYGNNEVGKNLLEITAETKTINGVTFTVDETTGTITADGTASATTNFFYSAKKFGAGTFIYSGITGGASTTYYLNASVDGSFSGNRLYDGEITYTPTSSVQRFAITIVSGTVLDNLVFKPMLRPADTSAAFEPYQIGVGEKTENGYVLNIGVGFPPISVADPVARLVTRKTINLGENPLTEGQTLLMSEFGDIGTAPTNMFIAAFKDFHYDSQLSYNQPTMMIKFKESEYE